MARTSSSAVGTGCLAAWFAPAISMASTCFEASVARAPARCRALQEDAHCVLRRSQGGSTWRDSVGRSGPVGSSSMADPVAELRSAVEAAASGLRDRADAGSSMPTLERPPKPEFGDYSTNAAMLLAPALGEQPRGTGGEAAEELGRTPRGRAWTRSRSPGPASSTSSSRTAGTGQPLESWPRRASGSVALRLPMRCRSESTVEFVSANPTGPVTAAGGRGARTWRLDRSGPGVRRTPLSTREYYINDRGGQIDRFAASVAARMKGEPCRRTATRAITS